MLNSGLTVEPRNLVCIKWFSDNTFLRQGLKIDQDFSSPCFIRHIFNHSVILMTGFIFCVTYIFLRSYFFFIYLLLFFFLFAIPFFPVFICLFLLLSHTSLTHFPYHKSTSGKKPTRGHTTPKRNMLLTNQILFALRLHFCWYLTIKTEGEQRFRCVSEWVYSSQNTVWATGTPVMAVEKNGTKSTIWTVQKRINKRANRH